jgi:hypothetical protein
MANNKKNVYKHKGSKLVNEWMNEGKIAHVEVEA